MHEPLVSVIVPCYNNSNEQYLRECFDSIVNQRYTALEIIVIDDGSTDGTSELLRRLQGDYGFILYKQENGGISAALNTGITKFSRGKYIAIIGSDDYWAADKISRQVNYMEAAESRVVASCTWGYFVYENNPARRGPRLTKRLSPEDLSFSGLLQSNCILQISVMIRADIFNEVGLFDESSAVEDWDMWLRIADRYKFGYVPEPLVYYRRHMNNLSNYFEQLYESHKYIVNKWVGRDGQRRSMNQVKINGINYFARQKKLKALKIALANLQCMNRQSYWRGVAKIFIPGFLLRP